jgi:hypothetical protein
MSNINSNGVQLAVSLYTQFLMYIVYTNGGCSKNPAYSSSMTVVFVMTRDSTGITP